MSHPLQVKYWITFNEPSDFCTDGYGTGRAAPKINANGIGEYLCANNVLRSHAMVYKLYQENYATRYKGKIGITLSSRFFYSEANDTSVVDRAMQFQVNSFQRSALF